MYYLLALFCMGLLAVGIYTWHPKAGMNGVGAPPAVNAPIAPAPVAKAAPAPAPHKVSPKPVLKVVHKATLPSFEDEKRHGGSRQ